MDADGAPFRAVPPVCHLMQLLADVPRDEMYRDFNMGIGMVVICAPENAAELRRLTPELGAIGEAVRQHGPARGVID